MFSGWWKRRTELRRKRSLKEERKGARSREREREQENCRQTDSFDSARSELAGFGEYGSFVVRRGPRGCFLLSIPPSRSSLSFPGDSRQGTEQNGTNELPASPARGETEWKRAGGDEVDEEIERMYGRMDLLFVTRVCVNSSFVSLSCPPVYKRPGRRRRCITTGDSPSPLLYPPRVSCTSFSFICYRRRHRRRRRRRSREMSK